MGKVDYGFDAPGIMRNLLIFGGLIIAIGFTIGIFTDHVIFTYCFFFLVFIGLILLILGLSMVAYGLKGKFNVRKMMLSKIHWKGDEMVLDIGAGTGLLMNGAAQYLTTGKSVGIDIWRAEDLSNNSLANALKNAELENVSDKIEIRTEDARNLSFPDNTFDVILSQFCIHNIEPKAEQEKACFEIARVLKPNGTALIGDYLPTHDYAKAFKKAGLHVKSSQSYFTTAYSLTWIVEAQKIQ
jgi:ubiquinone/menaquinone biosynthesis C-methylase UbiE